MHDLRFPSNWREYSELLKFVCRHAHASPPTMTSLIVSKEHSTHIKLSDGERLMSIEHTVAKILSFEVHTFIEKFLDPGLNSPE